ncbi:MAG: ATP-binding protein [Geobacteraceae bacterium]|nr:ATP-binding protein [Geobacteraceae bacterium]
MTIKTRLMTIAFLPAVLALLAVLCYFIMTGHVREQRRDSEVADQIAREVFEIDFLTDRYLIYHEPQLKAQWLAKHEAIGKRLAKARFSGDRYQQLLEKVRTSHREMEDIFTRLSAGYGNPGAAGDAELRQERQERLSGILLIKARELFVAASRLADLKRAETAVFRDRFDIALLGGLVFLAAVICAVSLLSGRRIVNATRILLQGTEIVASGNLDHRVETVSRDELGKLAAAFNAMTARLHGFNEELEIRVAERTTDLKQAEDALRKANEELETRVAERTEELQSSRSELETQHQKLLETYHELANETAERLRAMEEIREKDRMLIQQSRMAAMGEMLGNIAHQWRQPLNVLGLKLQQLGFSYEYGGFSRELLDANIDKAMEIVLHLSQTIDDFRKLTSPDKEKSLFRADQVVTKTVSIVEKSFKEQRITIEVSAIGEPQINGYPNEFGQVLLNILMNARDALLEPGTDDARVTVRSWTEEGKAVVTITDNAGGIQEEIMNKIFDPYFTTKELGKGTGIGLFMSKTIIEKNMGGCLTARNAGDGAEFRIEV